MVANTLHNASVTPEISSQVVLVTPLTAEKWLVNNHRNRKTRPSLVKRYAKEMEEGKWEENGQPIIFDWDGQLVNGQHRLSAIIQADTPIRTLIVRGVNPETFTTMDTGPTRNNKDVLDIAGYEDASSLARLARLVARYHKGRLDRTRVNLTNEEILVYVERDEDVSSVPMTESLRFVREMRGGETVCKRHVFAFGHWLLSRRAPGDAQLFITQLVKGTGLSDNSPIWALRDRFMRATATQGREGRLGEVERAAYMVKAWNLWRDDETMENHLLRWAKQDKFPVPL